MKQTFFKGGLRECANSFDLNMLDLVGSWGGGGGGGGVSIVQRYSMCLVIRSACSNPTTVRNENLTLEDLLHRKCPNGPSGSQWKTSDVKTRLVEKTKEKKKKKERQF